MGGKLGRNDPCWCGSGRKYKHCHLGREKEKPITLQEAATTFIKAYGKKYCLHPNASDKACDGGIIRAHTIQRNGGLSRIAQKGHVYSFLPNPRDVVKKDFQLQARLIGIKEASTFTGFCSLHDNITFEPIEKYPFQCNQQHTFLLAYRAICKEMFLKLSNIELVIHGRNLDRGKNKKEQIALQMYFRNWIRSVEIGLKEIKNYKIIYDRALLESDYSQVYYYVIQLTQCPEIMCSGVIQPEFDFNGSTLQTLGKPNQIADHISFTLIATDTGGIAVFSWLGESKSAIKLITSLHNITDDQLPQTLIRFMFELFENIYFSPEWWGNQDESIKSRLALYQMSGASPEYNRRYRDLLNDGLQIVSWNIVSRETNISL